MFVYLSKKIAIPNNVKLNCIAWNKEHGYIAAAGTEGLLKVLKLEQATAANGQNKGSLAALSNLSLNQTLDGHKSEVKVVIWNDVQQKLTSSDVNGVIMVWMLYKGSWYEEMTNDRKKSTVSGMHWTSDGTKICIVYDDGAIIVGSVDGNRLWGKELKNIHLSGVQWSPDNRLLIFSLHTGECHIYDNQGNFVMKVDIKCVNLIQSTNSSKQNRIAAIRWFNGKSIISPVVNPTLAICYANGMCQLMVNENDEDPILLNCKMNIADAQWNHDGTILALGGTLHDSNIAKESLCQQQQVAFYSPQGHLYRILKVPGNELSSISWEGKSLRLAMAVDSFIYFANIRIDYIWCYFDKTVAFLSNHNIPNSNSYNGLKNENTSLVTFWNINDNQTFLKEVEHCLGMTSYNDHCILAVECINSNMKQLAINAMGLNKKVDDPLYQILLCNTIGTTVDSTYVDIYPKFLAINSIYVAVASTDEIFLWHYHTPRSFPQLHNVKPRKEKRFRIDDMLLSVREKDFSINENHPNRENGMGLNNNGGICALAISESILLVAGESGQIYEYAFPNITLKSQYNINVQISKMSINCNSTRIAIIDRNGTLTLFDLDLDNNESHHLKFNQVERKDVWAVCWAKDNPQMLAFMEKTRMYIFRGNDPEEPIICSGYICTFENLEITSILLDDIISGGESQNITSHILQLKVKSLRDTDDLLQHVGLEDAKQFIEDNPHPRLWMLLAEAALKRLELNVAENAFVRCSNYPGIQLIKKLRNIPSGTLQKAEIAAFYGEYEEAEKLYLEADRRDLAINLRITLCDWFRVIQLYRLSSGISDQQLQTAWLEIGHHFANLRSWESAKVYYEKCQHIEGVMESLYNLEEFDKLGKCIENIPEKNALLIKLAKMLTSVGMCNEAVKAYLKFGDPKLALDTCLNLQQWDLAIELAEQYQMTQVNDLINQQINQFLKDGRLQDAMQLLRISGRYLDVARLLVKLAEAEIQKSSFTLLRVKKLYILAGLLCEQYIKSLETKRKPSNKEAEQLLDRVTLMESLNPEDYSTIESIWECAEAYHFLILAQQQLYYGVTHNAVSTALRLQQYNHILNIMDIYSVLALTSWADRSFTTCLYALEKLKSLENISHKDQQEYDRLMEAIVSKYKALDDRIELVPCYSCESIIADWLPSCPNCNIRFPPCISSGKPITQPTGHIWICATCNHCASSAEIPKHRTCPLCHTYIVSVPLKL